MRAVAILHVPDSAFGAVCITYARLARAMEARGHVLEVVTPDRFPRVGRWHPRWWVLTLPFAAAFWLWRRRRKYDLVIFHSYAGWVFDLLPDGLPVVTQFHGLEPLFYAALSAEHAARGRSLSRRSRWAYGWMMPRVLRASCRRSRLVTCLNGEESRYLLDHAWVTPDRLAIVRQSVPPVFFMDDRNYAARPTRIIALLQWLETKGIADLVEAFTQIARQHADVQLACYGTRVSAADVLDYFPVDVRARVVVYPEAPEDAIAAAFRAADLFVHPSLSEGSANAIMQAMASALPMAITRVGVAVDLLEDGRDCLFVPKANAGALAAAIERLLESAELRATLGGAARRAAEVLKFETSTAAMVSLLEQAARD